MIVGIGGFVKSGKTTLSESISELLSVSFPPTEFSFFRYFSEEKYRSRGGFKKNLDYFLEKCPKARQWELERSIVKRSGETRKDLYYNLLDSYRRHYKPEMDKLGDITPFLEQHFLQLIEWFGEEDLRLIQPIRNPYLNFASFKRKNLHKGNRYHRALLYTFCHYWSQSVALGLSLHSRYPRSFMIVWMDDYFVQKRQIFERLCDWVEGKFVKRKNDFKTIPSFVLDHDENSLLESLLSPKEKEVISQMSCLKFASIASVNGSEWHLDFKNHPKENRKETFSSSSIGYLVSVNSYFASYTNLLTTLMVIPAKLMTGLVNRLLTYVIVKYQWILKKAKRRGKNPAS